MLGNNATSYGGLSKFLHWAMALIILGLIALGLYMTGLDKEDLSRGEIFALHKSFGVIAFVLIVVRLIWNRISPPPPLPAALQGIERLLPHTVVALLYLLMIIVPLSGMAMSQFGGHEISVFGFYQLPMLVSENKDLGGIASTVHEYSSWAILALVVLHAAGAAKHRKNDPGGEKDILSRML